MTISSKLEICLSQVTVDAKSLILNNIFAVKFFCIQPQVMVVRFIRHVHDVRVSKNRISNA